MANGYGGLSSAKPTAHSLPPFQVVVTKPLRVFRVAFVDQPPSVVAWALRRTRRGRLFQRTDTGPRRSPACQEGVL